MELKKYAEGRLLKVVEVNLLPSVWVSEKLYRQGLILN